MNHQCRSAGYALFELMVVFAVITLLTAGFVGMYFAERAKAEEEVVRQNAIALLEAGRGWWAKYRTLPPTMTPSITDLAAAKLVDTGFVPVNPLGTGYAVEIVLLSSVACPSGVGTKDAYQVVVTADITRPGALIEWQERLRANGVTGTGVVWKRFMNENSTREGVRSRAFKEMYEPTC
jgi:type II secretory pathway pseudopilin PulG